jgi:hypothetical protein
MEGRSMALVIPDISPDELLSRFRGPVTKAHPAYPETIQVQVTDAGGGKWWFVTWDAGYSPSDPEALVGRAVIGADFDEPTGRLTVALSDGSFFEARPAPQEDETPDDPAYWQLFTPEGLVLNWGPCRRWKLKRAGDPV